MSDKGKKDVKQIEEEKKALLEDWGKVKPKVEGLDKDAWHKTKNEAGIKKTKWFQSASAIGPKIDKVKSSGKSFAEKLSADSYVSLIKSLESLETECKGFWTKHKDAKQEASVVKALDDYAKVAKEAYNVLAKHAGNIRDISALEGTKNIKAATSLGERG